MSINMSSSKSRVRFNILDIIIIVILIALIAGLFFRNNIIEMLNTDESTTITYTFEIKELDSSRFSYLKHNTLLTERESGGAMGRVISISSSKSVAKEYAVDGSIVNIEKNGYYDVVVKAAADGFKSDTGIFLNGDLLIAPGMNCEIVTETSVYKATILSVD